MMIAEEPTSQKKVETGEAIQRSGRPSCQSVNPRLLCGVIRQKMKIMEQVTAILDGNCVCVCTRGPRTGEKEKIWHTALTNDEQTDVERFLGNDFPAYFEWFRCWHCQLDRCSRGIFDNRKGHMCWWSVGIRYEGVQTYRIG